MGSEGLERVLVDGSLLGKEPKEVGVDQEVERPESSRDLIRSNAGIQQPFSGQEMTI